MARLVVPGYPHHVTQRGNRQLATFFVDNDYQDYLELLSANLQKAEVAIWAYCLMPNHVHLVAVPEATDGLARLLRITHHKYARFINERFGWQGHLWQERFHSFVMDEAHLFAAVRYVELNPVRAGLCAEPYHWPWSSVHAHLFGRPDPVVDPAPMLMRVPDWTAYLSGGGNGPSNADLRRHSRTGRPAGSESFITKLEGLSGRRLKKRKTGLITQG